MQHNFAYPSLVAGAYPPGVIVATAQSMPPAALAARDAAFAAVGRSRRKKPWIELAPPPPLMPAECLRQLHRAQLHAAVAKALGKRGSDFCAAIVIDIHGDSGEYAPTPHLVMATTRCRRTKWCDRIDLAVHECDQEFLNYYTTPCGPELARMNFNAYSRFARYKAVLTCGGLRTDTYATWGDVAEWLR